MAKSNHIGPHRYELVKIKRLVPREDGKGFKYEVVGARYKCQLPGCSHFLPSVELAEGQLSLCTGGCGEAVIITKMHIAEQTKKFICDECKEKRKEMRERMKRIA